MNGNVIQHAAAFQICRVASTEQRALAFDLRWRAYRKHFTLAGRTEVTDDFDEAPNCILLLAFEQELPVGTLRILDHRRGRIELDKFHSAEALLRPEERPVAEASRLAVPSHPRSRSIKLALWRAYLRYCQQTDIASMLVSGRRATTPDYEYLLFRNLGPSASYLHSQLDDVPHDYFLLGVSTAPEKYRAAQHPLHDFFFASPATETFAV